MDTTAGESFDAFMVEIRRFVRQRIVGKEREIDSTGELPLAQYESFVSSGLANWWLTPRVGGRGLSLEQSVDVVAELAYGDAGLAFAFFLPILGTSVVELFGTEAQRSAYLSGLAQSGGFCATAASEADAGSELIRMACVATPATNGHLIDGDKFFSTNAEVADFFVVYARVDGSTPSFGAFLVRGGSDRIQLQRRWPTSGVRGAGTYQLRFERCLAEDQLAGNGLRILEVGLNASRTLMAASAIGVARRVRDICLDYASSKQVKGQLLLDDAVFASKLAQMQVEIDTMVSVCRTAAREYDVIARDSAAADRFMQIGTMRSVIVAKMMCGQLGWKVASAGSEMLGGLGYTDDVLLGKLLRDVRYVSIVEAGDDVLRDLLYSRHVVPAFTAARS